MDLSNFQVNETHTVILTMPGSDEIIRDDNGDPMTVTIAGPDTKSAKNFDHEYFLKYLSESSKKDGKLTPEETEKLLFDKFVNLTVDWHLQFNGENPECNKKTVAEVYEKYPFVLKQVQEAFGVTENFIQVNSNS